MEFVDSPSLHYSPGLLAQDVYTIPLGLGLLTMMNTYYTRDPKPAWPFDTESATDVRNPTKHTRNVILPYAMLATVGTFGLAQIASPNFMWPQHIRGWIHAHLANELLTGFAKMSFQRHRPFYDTEVEREKQGLTRVREDDSFSFFSGHSSHAFTFAAYGSSVFRKALPYKWLGWTLTGGMYSAAAYIGATRAIDAQHYWSDVLTGAFVGTIVGNLIFQRVEDVIVEYNLRIPSPEERPEDHFMSLKSVVPFVRSDDEGKDIFGINLEAAL